ncbi:MAG: excalibur calcium-binding domain-containing protein, partial [Methylomicrobium sp.]|nr:excalibur calcium-binding domain-containing protein [Methylomicrobium sp.]
RFQCQGKEHCSQMTSYEEAVFYLRNCPSTKLDGDGDGIPCERQF